MNGWNASQSYFGISLILHFHSLSLFLSGCLKVSSLLWFSVTCVLVFSVTCDLLFNGCFGLFNLQSIFQKFLVTSCIFLYSLWFDISSAALAPRLGVCYTFIMHYVLVNWIHCFCFCLDYYSRPLCFTCFRLCPKLLHCVVSSFAPSTILIWVSVFVCVRTNWR